MVILGYVEHKILTGWRPYSAPIARRKRVFSRTPSRGGNTRGGSSARIAIEANKVVGAFWIRAEKSRSPVSSMMSKVSLNPQARAIATSSTPSAVWLAYMPVSP